MTERGTTPGLVDGLTPAVRHADCPRCGAKAGERCVALGLPAHDSSPTRREPGVRVVWVHAARIRAHHGAASR